MDLSGRNISIEDPWVFISYAKEDKKSAISLYKKLIKSNLRPWLDIHGLDPGMEWENIIPTVIRQSKFFIVLLSQNAVGKRGFIQKEIRLALSEFEKMPVNSLFIIPILLDNCEVPFDMSRYQWIRASERGFYKKIEQTLIKNLGKLYAAPSISKPKKSIIKKSDASILQNWREFFAINDEISEGHYNGKTILTNLHIAEVFESNNHIIKKVKELANKKRNVPQSSWNNIIVPYNENLLVTDVQLLQQENIYLLKTADPKKFAHVNKKYYEYLLARYFPCAVYISESIRKKTYISPVSFYKNNQFAALIMPFLHSSD